MERPCTVVREDPPIPVLTVRVACGKSDTDKRAVASIVSIRRHVIPSIPGRLLTVPASWKKECLLLLPPGRMSLAVRPCPSADGFPAGCFPAGRFPAGCFRKEPLTMGPLPKTGAAVAAMVPATGAAERLVSLVIARIARIAWSVWSAWNAGMIAILPSKRAI